MLRSEKQGGEEEVEIPVPNKKNKKSKKMKIKHDIVNNIKTKQLVW